MCVNHLCNKTSVLKSFLQQKSVRKSFSRQKKYLKLQFDVQVRIICCFCNVLSSNHAWLYILGKAHTQLPFLTHLILVPSLGCVFLMRTCYRLIKIRQKGWIAIAKLKPLSLFFTAIVWFRNFAKNTSNFAESQSVDNMSSSGKHNPVMGPRSSESRKEGEPYLENGQQKLNFEVRHS